MPARLFAVGFQPTTDSSRLTRTRHDVRYIMAEAPTPFLHTHDPLHELCVDVWTYVWPRTRFSTGRIALCFRSIRVSRRETFSQSYKYRDNRAATCLSRPPPRAAIHIILPTPWSASDSVNNFSIYAEKNPAGRCDVRWNWRDPCIDLKECIWKVCIFKRAIRLFAKDGRGLSQFLVDRYLKFRLRIVFPSCVPIRHG